MKIIANLLRNGNIIKHQDKMYQVIKTSTIKPGKGGAYIQVEMRDIVNGLKTNERWRTSENVEKLNTEEVEATFLFINQDKITLMQNDTYEQIEIDASILKNKVNLLEDGMQIKVDVVDEKIINVNLPKTIEVEIDYADAVVKGQTASTSYKTASTKKGLKISVPPHIKQGDKIIIHSENLEYIEKSKK